MKILGNIGIDPFTILAQIVDFFILMFFLNKYLYKSVIDQIEKNEKALNQAQEEKQRLEDEKLQLQKDKNALMLTSQQKSRKILKDAEELSERIKKDATKQAKQKASEIIYQVKKQLEEKESEIRRQMREEEKQKVTSDARE
jgi:F-type H+-transporting ATPase subunit b